MNKSKNIKPSFPYISFIIIGAFFALSLAFAISPLKDIKFIIASIIFGTLGFSMGWIIDYSCLFIDYSSNDVKFRGYFGIRKFELEKQLIEGYQIHQKVDQINGFHEEAQLIIKDRENVILPRIAYANYDDILKFCQEFKFLGYREIRYGKLLGKLVPLMFIISGIFSLLIGLIKFMK